MNNTMFMRAQVMEEPQLELSKGWSGFGVFVNLTIGFAY